MVYIRIRLRKQDYVRIGFTNKKALSDTNSSSQPGIDVDQMPLGKLSKGQIGKGAAIMQEILKAVQARHAILF